MKIIFDNFLIPAVSAIVGMFWLLAYKHPKTFRAIAAPVIFIAIMILVGSFGYIIAWSTYDMRMGSWADFWDPYDDVDEIQSIQSSVSAEVSKIGKLAVPVAVISGSTLTLMIFLLYVSRLIHLEKNGKDPFDDKEDNKPESEALKNAE